MVQQPAEQSYSPSNAFSPPEAIIMPHACQLCQVVNHEQPSAGLTCKAQAAHFICSSCFQAHVSATISQASFAAMGCRVYCPVLSCEASLPGHGADTEMQRDIAYTDQQVSDHVDDDTWSKYLSAAQPEELEQDTQQGQGGADQERGGPSTDAPGKLPPAAAAQESAAAAAHEVCIVIQPAGLQAAAAPAAVAANPAAAAAGSLAPSTSLQRQEQAMKRLQSEGQEERRRELDAADCHRRRQAEEEEALESCCWSTPAGAWPWVLRILLGVAVMAPIMAVFVYPELAEEMGAPGAVGMVVLIVLLAGLRGVRDRLCSLCRQRD